MKKFNMAFVPVKCGTTLGLLLAVFFLLNTQQVRADIFPDLFIDEDSGQNNHGNGCSLREAVKAANDTLNRPYGGCPAGTSDTDLIILVGAPYSVTLGTITISSNVNINGNGATINGGGRSFRLFKVINPASDVTFLNLHILNYKGGAFDFQNTSGTNFIFDSTIEKCGNTSSTFKGGGILNNGNLNIDGVTIYWSPGGSAVHSSGRLTVVNCELLGNNGVRGGGIYNTGWLDVEGSGIYFNSASTSGGGIYSKQKNNPGNGAISRIYNSWITDNEVTATSGGAGGGLFVDPNSGGRLLIDGGAEIVNNFVRGVSDRCKINVSDTGRKINYGVATVCNN
jgi:CSLREA domain-containing protein